MRPFDKTILLHLMIIFAAYVKLCFRNCFRLLLKVEVKIVLVKHISDQSPDQLLAPVKLHLPMQ